MQFSPGLKNAHNWCTQSDCFPIMFVLLREEISSYGIDCDGPIPSDFSNGDDCMHVEVSDIQVSLDEEQQQHFIGLLDPLGDSVMALTCIFVHETFCSL